MRFPKFLQKNNTIGLASPSFGISDDPYFSRYNSAKEFLNNEGYQLIETASAYKLENAESNDEKTRASELMELYFNDNVDFIFSNAGGELMVEILPYLDFDKIRESEPKFFMGYSDNTNFTFTITTICDIASIYGPHTPSFGMRPIDDSTLDAYSLVKGEKLKFNSYPYYQDRSLELELLPLENYPSTIPVFWDTINNTSFEGRIIGGCLDCLLNLVGTKYDNVKNFTEKYKNDGIIWYLEGCELNSLATKRGLWLLKENGWFKYVKGFIFGRPLNTETPFDVSYKDAVYDILDEYNVPIVLNSCIGHVSPSIPIINGSYAKVAVNQGFGTIEMILKD